jgi:2-keto-4-pentenoate hydratase/2-oxohepta-3-ene-1,7-dioic acid hydratase in catechol pathway
MKLCRFELLEAPGQPRSGLLHGEKLYETDGVKALGMHGVETVRLLPPVAPPSVRAFDEAESFDLLNPAGLVGPLTEIELLEEAGGLVPELRVAAVVGDSEGEPSAESFVGLTIMLCFVDEHLAELERRAGRAPGLSRNLPIAIGPYLTTPDDLEANLIGNPEEARYRFTFRLQAGSRHYEVESWEMPFGFVRMAAEASRGWRLHDGEALATPSLLPLGEGTEVSPPLVPGDEIRAQVGGLGTLLVRLA